MKAIILSTGKIYKMKEIIHSMIHSGYERNDLLTSQGTFSVLGGDIKVFAPNISNHVRLEFFGEELEKIVEIDPQNNKKLSEVVSIEFLPNVLVLDDKTKIKPGEYVVHEDHGIGLFSNIGTKIVEGKPEIYIFINYLNNDVLYLPINLKDKISPYIGIGRKKPKLNKLGSQTWKKTYQKTYENIIKFARELLKIYAERELVKKSPWKIDQRWEKSLKRSFGYVETGDQLTSLNQVFSDLESDKPMDRLIIGDVGFGKTEMAIRAAGQACANGYQVAIIVPTTVLAEQHYFNLRNRFSSLPVKVGHISRLVGEKEKTSIKEDLKNGLVDIVVGTHALLSEGIKFKNLGLLVIDEEQKFGVKDKENLKKLRSDVNVLSMSATPIPRTLFMAISGLRDISQIYTPPEGRREIDTKVAEYDEQLIKKYIERELVRKGQAYYLHNEVATIVGTKNKLTKLLPGLRIEVAHGQMGEGALARVMGDFVEGKIDVMVCSTIIENGIDLANVNTLVVEDADRFGLSQLYQIRGRIGRSPKQSYALFTFPKKTVSNNAFKRLKALVENTELGSGYSIALSDLEIRGGGNVLGKEQHGNMEAIGLVLYSKMLNQAVKQLKNSR